MPNQDESISSSSSNESKGSVPNTANPGLSQLEEIRKQIDRVDETISSLISTRLDLVRKIADIKREFGLPTLDGDREKKVLENVLGNASDSASAHAISTIYEALLRLSKDYQRNRRTHLDPSRKDNNSDNSLSDQLFAEGEKNAKSIESDNR